MSVCPVCTCPPPPPEEHKCKTCGRVETEQPMPVLGSCKCIADTWVCDACLGVDDE